MSNTITSEIKFLVELDENRVPERLSWTAQDGGVDTEEAKAIMLSVWDSKAQETMRIDLWTKEMSIEEMKQFFHQSLLTMADSFEKATGEHLICEDLRDYCFHFAEKMQILPEEK